MEVDALCKVGIILPAEINSPGAQKKKALRATFRDVGLHTFGVQVDVDDVNSGLPYIQKA